VYVRAEYPIAHARLEHAFELARAHGFLGEDIMGTGFDFDLELRIGAGAYVCGEETALFQSIEGYRGEPRNKPPFPVEVGLFGKPTVVNNVETLVNVPTILLGDTRDTRLFCVSGHVERPGLYELELGTPLRDLLELAGSRPPKAVLLGGAAGSFLRPDQLDVPLSFEGARTANATLGSGVVMVFDESADLVGAVLRIAEFFRDESCGQCVPCRVGTVRQEEALHRLASGKTNGDELEVLADLTQVMRDASICGLGQTAANAVASAIENLGVLAPQ
jgi:NADH-quinone oxidoreductase subunit F